ncbi:MAG: helix-turn-helix domain-containing protein [bacterium]
MSINPNGNTNPNNLLTIQEARNYLHCSTQEIYLLIKKGKLPAHKLQRKYLIRQADVDAFFERCRYIPPALSTKIEALASDIGAEFARLEATRGGSCNE